MVLEIATFHLIDNVKETDFLNEHKKVHETWVIIQPGYVSRVTTKSDVGEWKDVITWESMEHAHNASKNIMSSPEVGPWMKMIDPKSISMYHGEIIVPFS